MKKIKLTIYKKMFLVLLIAFISVNAFTLFVEYLDSKNEIINEISQRIGAYDYAMGIAEEFSKKEYQINDQEFLKSIKEFVEQEQRSYPFNYMIIDSEYRPVNEFYNLEGDYIQFSYQLDPSSSVQRMWYLKSLGIEDKQYELENEIRLEAKQKDVIEVCFILDESDNFSYLKIGNLKLIDNTSSKEYIKTTLDTYKSNQIQYSYNRLPNYSKKTQIIDYSIYENVIISEIRERSHSFSLRTKDTQYRILYGEYHTFEYQDSIISYKIVPLLRNGLEYNIDHMYNMEDFAGYIVVYESNIDILNKIFDSILNRNVSVYIMSIIVILIVCVIITYSFSRRIVDIDKATRKIAENDFDIKLKVETSDEIGSLSKNINTMSQKINDTIQDLNNELEHVKKLESVKSEFIANFTHEIKTPLSIINGYIELIDECKDENKKKEYLEEINKETDRINELVLAMLNLSRLQSGHVELNIDCIDIDELITSALDSFTPLIQNKKLKVLVDSDSSQIQADPQELSVVLKNFISNAIKHTPDLGKIRITVKEQVITIENEGSHIDNDQIDKIWETYVSSDREGTGLGLAINKSILDLHGFDYDVYNTDLGVCFKVICKKNGS